MSTPTPEILPYATPEGIKHYVPLEDFEALAAKAENQQKELNRFNNEITSLQRREGKMRDDMRRMKVYEGIVFSVRNILGAENEEKTEDAAKRVAKERDLARERGLEMADVLQRTEDERRDLIKDVSALLRALDAHDVAEGVNTAMHLREAVAELNERMTTEVKSYMASIAELRAENRRLEKELAHQTDMGCQAAVCGPKAALDEVIRRMEAVPLEEVAEIIRRQWLDRGGWIEPAADALRARLIAAVRGEAAPGITT